MIWPSSGTMRPSCLHDVSVGRLAAIPFAGGPLFYQNDLRIRKVRETMRTLKRTAVFLLTLLWLAGCGLCSFAAGDQPVLWAAQTEQSAVLYLPQSGDVTECLVGSVKCTGVQSKAISELEHPIHTLILLDNSLSIPKESRETISKILDNLVGNRMQGELYTIATISDDIRYLCSAESDYLSLGSAIDGITYENQNTQLTDRVYEAVQKLYDADPTQLCRVVIISDGVDDKQIGYTRTELENLLRSCGYPIYTVGCGPNDTAERKTKLENLFALSRVNRGQSWYLAETNDTFAIAKGICEYNGAQRVTAKLPDEVCDGSTRAIQVTCGGTGYSTQLKMPFVAASEPASSVSSAPASSAVEPVQDNSNQTRMLLLLAGAGAAVVIVLVVVFVVLGRKKKADAKKKDAPKDPPLPARHGTVVVTVDDDTPGVQKTWNAEKRPAPAPVRPKPQPVPPPQPVDPGDATVRMFGRSTPFGETAAAGARTPVLRLTDLNNAANTYEVPLDDIVTIGRSAGCRLVLSRPSVSHSQCDIFVQNGRVCITNRSATNPTCVNGHPVGTASPLPDGCVLTMGNEKMKVVIV